MDTVSWRNYVVGDPVQGLTATTAFTDHLPGDTSTFQFTTRPVNEAGNSFVIEGLHAFDQPNVLTAWQCTLGGGYTTFAISIHGAWTAAYSVDGTAWTDLDSGTAAYTQNGTAWLTHSGTANALVGYVRLQYLTTRVISQNPTAFIGDFRLGAFPQTLAQMAATAGLVFGGLAGLTATALPTATPVCDCCEPTFNPGCQGGVLSYGGCRSNVITYSGGGM